MLLLYFQWSRMVEVGEIKEYNYVLHGLASTLINFYIQELARKVQELTSKKYYEVASKLNLMQKNLGKFCLRLLWLRRIHGRKLLPLELEQAASHITISVSKGWLSMIAMQKLLQEECS